MFCRLIATPQIVATLGYSHHVVIEIGVATNRDFYIKIARKAGFQPC